MAFRGLIATIPVGQQGFNGSKNASKLGPGHFGFVEGVDIDGGVLVKDGGAEKLNVVALGSGSKVMSGINWSPEPGSNDDVIFLSNGQMRKDTGLGTFPTLLTTVGIPTLFPPFYVKGGGESNGQPRKLFMFNEASQVQVVMGSANTAAPISNPPADWATSFPIFGVQHDLRIWAGGQADDPHRIYFSTTGDHGNYIGRDAAGAVTPPYVDLAGSLSIYPGEGEQLVGGISFRGLLILFKYPAGIYMVDTRDSIENWSVTRLNDAVGACSPWCIVQISNDVLVLDNVGHFHVMSAVTDFSDQATSDISAPQQMGPFMRENVNLLGMRKAMGAWYGSKKKAWFMVPLAGAVDNNLRIMLDFNEPTQGTRFYLFRRDVGCSLWMRPSTQGIRKPVLGDDEGFVWLMDEDERNKDGLAYQMYMETSETDFSFLDPELAPRTKNGQYIEIVSDLVRNTNLSIVPSWDGFVSTPINMAIGSASAALGSFVLDVDVLGSSGTVTAQSRLDGQGRRLKLTIENNELDDEVRLSEIRVGFTVADERLRYE